MKAGGWTTFSSIPSDPTLHIIMMNTIRFFSFCFFSWGIAHNHRSTIWRTHSLDWRLSGSALMGFQELEQLWSKVSVPAVGEGSSVCHRWGHGAVKLQLVRGSNSPGQRAVQLQRAGWWCEYSSGKLKMVSTCLGKPKCTQTNQSEVSPV